EGLGVHALGGLDVLDGFDQALALQLRVGRGEAFEHGLALGELLLDLGVVGRGVVGRFGPIAPASAPAQAVALAFAAAAIHAIGAVELLADLVQALAGHAVLGVLKV